MLRSVILTFAFLACCAGVASAQVKPGMSDSRDGREGMPDQAETHRQEMLRNLRIKREESNFKQTLERARENAQLGAELLNAYQQNQNLTAADLKKIARMNKLARQIRGETGGSDDKFTVENPPTDVAGVVERLAQLSEGLRKNLDKSSRHVISAEVICQANELIEIIRLARNITGQ
ncbi:MAG: hypothetical protein ACRD9R_10530 [Pyrinomonadaceae bacterium]